jgi:hypothetical protein
MSTPWRCAVCESANEGGGTCAACGARRTGTTTLATPVPDTPAREIPRQEERGIDFNAEVGADPDDSYAGFEGFEVRPRVRVYGCCLPLFLGMLLVFIGAATVLASLAIRAL